MSRTCPLPPVGGWRLTAHPRDQTRRRLGFACDRGPSAAEPAGGRGRGGSQDSGPRHLSVSEPVTGGRSWKQHRVLSCRLEGSLHQEASAHGRVWTGRVDDAAWWPTSQGWDAASGTLRWQTLAMFTLGESLRVALFARGLPGSSVRVRVNSEK